MSDLDAIYSRLLTVGFVVLRQAVDAKDDDWINAELELLHNVPSLIGESNTKRHQHFWFEERSHYIEWVSAASNKAAESRMRTFYEPIWDELEQVVLPLVEEQV